MLSNMSELYGAHPDVQLLQENVRDALRPFITNAFLDGSLIEAQVLLSAAPTIINHKLGRKLRGWLIVDQNASAVIYRTNSTVRQNEILELTTTANVTVSLYVF